MIDKSLLKNMDYSSLPNLESVPNPYPLSIGIVHTFKMKGAALSKHAHSDENTHYTIIISGKFLIERTSGSLMVEPGDILDFLAGDPHTITCVEPGVIFNGIKFGTDLKTLLTQMAQLANLSDKISANFAAMKA